jgi:MFS-type transporter involved in bile tolerance (Atg22 family)
MIGVLPPQLGSTYRSSSCERRQMSPSFREASKLGQFSWALFDWANQPFFTVVTTFIFAPYFANVMVGNAVEGQAAWAFTQSTSGILIALMSPFLGAMADAGGPRKPYIFTFQLLLGVGCAALWWAYPGRPDLIGPISAAVVIATIGAEMSIVFNNAQLPHIVRHERMGWLSGFGWGLGYCGGLIALFIVLAVNDLPLFGLDPKTYALERLVGPASALWLAVFVIPMFLFTPDTASQKLTLLEAARQGGSSLFHTVKKIGRFGNALRYLIAFMLYNDGLASIIASAASRRRDLRLEHRHARHLRHHPDGVRHSCAFLGQPGRSLRASAPCRATLGDRGHARHRERKRPTRVLRRAGQRDFATRACSLVMRLFLGSALLLGFCIKPMQAAAAP